MTPRATIALLNWNGGDFVRPCLDSVLRQSEQNIEIVVVDNNSSDGSADVIEALLDASSVKYELVRLDENRGICGGLRVAPTGQLASTFFPSPPTTRCSPTEWIDSATNSTRPGRRPTSLPGRSPLSGQTACRSEIGSGGRSQSVRLATTEGTRRRR